MRIVFMGSDELAVPSLEKLQADPNVELLVTVTQPNRPAGRKKRLTPCPVKARAMELGLAVHDPEKIGSPESYEILKAVQPDVQVVAAYGQYIPSSVLAIPSQGSINLHPSLLPRYRGASPIQWAIADGLSETGITILYVSREMDAGDIILQETFAIDPALDAIGLKKALSFRGGDLLLMALEQIRNGTATRSPQDESKAVYVGKLSREDGCVDWTHSAESIHNRVRGFKPWPGTYTSLPGGGVLKIHQTRLVEGHGHPGVILENSARFVVATGCGALELLEVQAAGKPKMISAAFLNGHPLQLGDQLG